MKKLLLSSLLCMATLCSHATSADSLISRQKIVDNGGTGLFKAYEVIEKSLPGFTVFRPENLSWAAARENALPILIFCNGGCMDAPIHYERMLTDIASHGYVVIAVGEMQMVLFDRKEHSTPSTVVTTALDWICSQARDKNSDYYSFIDTTKIAAAGHSCGGAQVLCNAADTRLKSYIILNAGMGNMTMAGADSKSLHSLHAPIIYMTGGTGDVAYQNACLDYERIDKVPVIHVDMPTAGHGATYKEKLGGSFGRLMLDWLDWQLKGKKGKSDVFLAGNIKSYPGWNFQHKNFKAHVGKTIHATMPCNMLEGVTEREYTIYLPGGYEENTNRQYPVLYLLHGGGGSCDDWETYGSLRQTVDSLIDAGYIRDFILVCPEANKNNMMYFNAPKWKYEDFFFQEFIPYIEKNYRLRTDKGGRAIAGFSMGGGAAIVYGVHHPEFFSMVYDISGYLRRQELDFLKKDPSAEWRQEIIENNNPIKCIQQGSKADVKNWSQVRWMVSVGDQDFTLEGNMDMVKAFREKGIPYQMHVSAGSHDWKFVSPNLKEAIKQADSNFDDLWISNGNRHLYGLLSRPTNTFGKMPLVIVSHGFNGTHVFGKNYIKAFNALGYQTYNFDFGCGSVSSRSDNNTVNMSIRDEVNDLKTIINYFKSRSDVDASNIILLGESQGGLVSALTASDCAKDISRLILVYPALCIPDNWKERYPKSENIPDTTQVWNVPIGKRFFSELYDINVYKTIGKYSGPVLIIHGDKDPVVPLSYSRRAENTYKNARLKVIPGAGHGFKSEELKISIMMMEDFLK